MIKISKNETNDRSDPPTYNYLDKVFHCKQGNELIFEELHLKCQALENEKKEMLRIRQNLLILNETNESISKRLSIIKTDSEFYKSHLRKILFNLKVTADKQRILSRKKLDEFLRKEQRFQYFQEYYRVSNMEYELEELINRNRHLQDEWERKTDLLRVTKMHHIKLVSFLIKTFQNKVCEFCDVVLRSKPAHT